MGRDTLVPPYDGVIAPLAPIGGGVRSPRPTEHIKTAFQNHTVGGAEPLPYNSLTMALRSYAAHARPHRRAHIL